MTVPSTRHHKFNQAVLLQIYEAWNTWRHRISHNFFCFFVVFFWGGGGWIHGSKPLHIIMHTVICHKFAVMFEVIGAPNVPPHRTDIYETLCRHLVLLTAELWGRNVLLFPGDFCVHWASSQLLHCLTSLQTQDEATRMSSLSVL